ncbi:AI-2E family transporter [Pseudomonas sp. HT11]|uniref:AI-2E family transporter n=1 Tax=Pseudomonas sp. HT11 TaxID=3230490 RepID=UPI00384C7BE4
MNENTLHYRTLLLLLIGVSLAFIWIMLPYYGAIFWAVCLAIVFSPMQRRLQARFKLRRNLTSLITLGLCLIIAILPVIITTALLIQQGTSLYQGIESGQIDIASYVTHFKQALPTFAERFLDRMGVGNLVGLQDKVTNGAMQGSQAVATQAFSFGQGTLDFVISFFIMLYLLFFFLRDGADLARRVRNAIPMDEHQKRQLQLKFNRVIRATVKGNILMALVQGALGGVIFWVVGIPSVLLWAVSMAFLSLLPAVGAGVVWAPVAIWLLATGQMWQGVVLGLFGTFVIGLVDNVLRPVLVGKDTKMPDYLVLLSTLGGLAVFGINGFVIGPLIAALFMSCWGLFTSDRRKVKLPS